MNDVVRYRIKNTGNRKPQLVTTDFDVLEDMFVKDWDVAYSFSIRYKHLLVNGQGQQETDKDIDHILGVVSGEDEAEAHEEDEKSVDYDKQNFEDVEEEDENDDEVHHGAPTADKQREMQAYSQIYPYGPPLGPWGQPLPYTSFGGYGGCGMHGEYGAHGSLANNSMDSHLPFGYTDRQKVNDAADQRSHDTMKGNSSLPGGGNKRIHSNSLQRGLATSRHDHPIHDNAPHRDPQDAMVDAEAKHESSSPSVPPSTSENEVQDLTDRIGGNYSATALEAELRATELELKVARLQAKRAALSKQTKSK
ncbi:hypothetical protein G6514_001877 [Epicoccum nigrum]|nr:hypothetical protein G6514_001877 [Epicoccum nigrum]